MQAAGFNALEKGSSLYTRNYGNYKAAASCFQRYHCVERLVSWSPVGRPHLLTSGESPSMNWEGGGGGPSLEQLCPFPGRPSVS